MSSRENQGIQIALIIFVIITVVLCVFTYFFYSQGESRGKQLAQLEAKNRTLTNANNLLDSKVQHLAFYIGQSDLSRTELEDAGLPSDENLDKWKAKFEKDMKMYGEGLLEDKLNYSTLPENLIAAIRLKNTGIADANDRLKTAVATRDRTVQDETKKTAAALAGQKKASDDLAQVNVSYNADRDRYKTELSTTAKSIADLSK